MNILDTLTKDEEKYVTYKNYKNGQVVFNDQDECKKLGIIIEGGIIIKTYTYLEKEETITILSKDMLFGHNLLFSKYHYYLGDGIVDKKTRIAFISKYHLELLLKTNVNFMFSYISYISDQSYEIKQQAKLLAHKNIEDRIMYYLKTNAINNKVIIKDVTTLANILSLPRPSVSRSLTRLEMENQIIRDNKIIYIKRG